MSFAELMRPTIAQQRTLVEDPLNQLLSAELEDLISRGWAIHGSECEWQITSSSVDEMGKNDPNNTINDSLFRADLIGQLGQLNTLESMAIKKTGIQETRFEGTGSTVIVRSQSRDGKQFVDGCSVIVAGNEKEIVNINLVFRPTRESADSEGESLIPIPEGYQGMMSQRKDDGSPCTSILVCQSKKSSLLDFWGAQGYSVAVVTRSELPEDCFLLEKMGRSYAVWNPQHEYPHDLAVVRSIPNNLAKLLLNCSRPLSQSEIGRESR